MFYAQHRVFFGPNFLKRNCAGMSMRARKFVVFTSARRDDKKKEDTFSSSATTMSSKWVPFSFIKKCRTGTARTKKKLLKTQYCCFCRQSSHPQQPSGNVMQREEKRNFCALFFQPPVLGAGGTFRARQGVGRKTVHIILFISILLSFVWGSARSGILFMERAGICKKVPWPPLRGGTERLNFRKFCAKAWCHVLKSALQVPKSGQHVLNSS